MRGETPEPPFHNPRGHPTHASKHYFDSRGKRECYFRRLWVLQRPRQCVIKKYFRKYAIAKAPEISLLITHSHTDHVGNLSWFRSLFPQLQTYASAAETNFITYPLFTTPYYENVNTTGVGKSSSRFLHRIAMAGALPIMFGRMRFYNPVDFTFTEKVTTFKASGRVIKPILTPGHYIGHCAYLDESKFLFLGDLVPNTPWLDPAPSSLDQMIQSIQKLLRIPDRKVEYVVRSHCNSRDHGRFIYP